MLDFGLFELLLIVALGVLVVGPNEIPKVMVMLGRVVRRIQYIRYAFSQQFEDFMREADLQDIRRQVNFEDRDFNEAEADGDVIPPEDEDGQSDEDEGDGEATK